MDRSRRRGRGGASGLGDQTSTERWSVPPISRDPGDDSVIACAVVGQADVIVSGDRDLLELGQVGEIPILSAAQFLDLIEERQGETQR